MEGGSEALSSVNLDDFSQSEKKDLQQFLAHESQKVRLQSSIHVLTDLCWKKCITSKITSAKIDSYEQPCVENCVDRYIDSQTTVLKHIQSLRGGV